MCFSRPEYLVFLWLVVPSLLIAFYGARRKLIVRRRIAGGSADPAIAPEFSFFRLFARRMMFCAAIALFFLAMSGPELCSGQKPVRRKGADVVFMLDVSASMYARDVAPDRLSQAKAEILQISRSFANGRRALMLFAATPVVQCPLTTDQELFESLLDMASPDLVSSQGTVYRRAFDTALYLVDAARRENGGETVLVLVGDGEDHGHELGAAISGLKSRGVRLHAIGIGTGAPVPIPLPPSATGPAAMKLDSDGKVVMTSFRPGFFAETIRASGGRFYHSSPDAPVARRVSSVISSDAAASRWVLVTGNRRPVHRPVIAAAIMALFAGMTTSDVSRRRHRGAKG